MFKIEPREKTNYTNRLKFAYFTSYPSFLRNILKRGGSSPKKLVNFLTREGSVRAGTAPCQQVSRSTRKPLGNLQLAPVLYGFPDPILRGWARNWAISLRIVSISCVFIKVNIDARGNAFHIIIHHTWIIICCVRISEERWATLRARVTTCDSNL